MKAKSLRCRQIHLDFHTSPLIERIGASFEKKAWQESLRRARVDSITCFSKCHHGLSYHPTAVGTIHPHLKFDLLRAQIDACREIGVKVPVYLSAGVDNTITQPHPEWRELDAEGRLSGWNTSPLQPGFHKLCFNTPYLDYLCAQIREACRLFPEADGIFLDIIFQGPCCCHWCMESMAEGGYDAAKEEDRLRHAEQVLEKYFQKTTAAAQEADPDMPVFHNSGHITRGRRDQVAYQTHLELESLPTGGWGYDHFPESATYAAHLGKDYLGMTGKFHTSWGEFGGFKHPNALRYECAAMIAFGAKCSIGDQLHPEGTLDPSTYEVIRAAYAEVEAKEPWCGGAVPLSDIAILSSEAVNGKKPGHSNPPDTGACRILLEGHHLFSLIDTEVDFTLFKLLILPDEITVNETLKGKIDAYLKGGGKLLLSGTSALSEKGFLFDIGAEPEGESPFSPDYIVPAEGFQADFVSSPLVMYTRSQRIKARKGKSLGQVFDPFFNWDFRHFSSHQHTPNRSEPSGYDCGTLHGNIGYLAHPVFTLYTGFGAVAHREYVLAVIDSLLGEARTVRSNLPSQARVTLTRQSSQKRRIVHLLYANKHARGGKISVGGTATQGSTIEVIEGLEPLHDVHLTIGDASGIRRATLEPQGKEVPFIHKGNTIEITVDSFSCHQMVVLHEG